MKPNQQQQRKDQPNVRAGNNKDEQDNARKMPGQNITGQDRDREEKDASSDRSQKAGDKDWATKYR